MKFPHPHALLLDDNLLSSTRVAAQLSALGYQTRVVRVVPEVDESGTQLILINLGSRNLNGVQLIETCRQRFTDACIIGFCGHKEVEIRRAAKAVNIDKILTNDQALSQLKESL